MIEFALSVRVPTVSSRLDAPPSVILPPLRSNAAPLFTMFVAALLRSRVPPVFTVTWLVAVSAPLTSRVPLVTVVVPVKLFVVAMFVEPAPVLRTLFVLPPVFVMAEPRVKLSPVPGESVTVCALATAALCWTRPTAIVPPASS